jgi:carbonic anhydrase
MISHEKQQQMTPESALRHLMDGNRRFVQNRLSIPDYAAEVSGTAKGQYPFAAVLGCIDSRAPAELVFDQGIGDIFNARVAGNIVNEDILGSLEYACKVAGSKLILVLGHTACGAVTAATKQVELGNITALLSKILPAVRALDQGTEVDEVARKNVQLNIQRIREESEILAELEAEGAIRIVGAMYDVSSGQVSLLDEAPGRS